MVSQIRYETRKQYKEPQITFQNDLTENFSLQFQKGHANFNVKSFEDNENRIHIGLRDETSAYNGYYQLTRKRVVDMSNGKSYLESVVIDHAVTSVKHNVLGGLPSIKGTRVPISTIIACLAEEMSIAEISEDYDLSPEQIKSSLLFIVDVLNRPYYGDE
ncbi:DUF433 domain-containing protein [Paenisporosarcina sp. FSL H8-0542]|uniref:DUF433 domain-containing protein n=1 Tax=Paenisporosarcina sp. FSL H8-0542 TaxID=2921401 RepID=UPI00315AE8F8